MTLTLLHCDLHVDAEGEQIACPGHYLRLGTPVRFTLASGHPATVTPWEEVPR